MIVRRLAARLSQRIWRASRLDLIRASLLFNADWYLDRYRDVRDAGIDPAWHYLVHGGFENRDPSPSFSSAWYLDTYEDVRVARINPLLHYLLHGRSQGRTFATRLKAINDLLTITHKVFVIGTAATSLAAALEAAGYRIGSRHQGEGLLDDWHRRDFRALLDHCHSADAFQGVPFSLPSTYKALDSAFPDAKFILTVHDSVEQWYKAEVIAHFKDRPQSLLVLNLAHETAAAGLVRFLGIGQLGMTIPHLSATPDQWYGGTA